MTLQKHFIDQFSSLYEDATFIVTYKNPNLEMIYCNKMMRDYVGCSLLKNIQGKTDYDFRWVEFADLYKNHENDALKNNIYPAIYPTCNAEGQEALVLCHRSPYFKKNNPIGILTHTYLLNEKKFLELSNILKRQEPENPLRSYTIDKPNWEIKLTKKERECLFFLIRGKSLKLIGKILGLSPRTIETYINNLKIKFICYSKIELIDKATAQGYMYDFPQSLFNNPLTNALKET